MKRLTVLFLILCVFNVFAQEDHEVAWEEATGFYKAENYEEALPKAITASGAEWEHQAEAFFMAGKCSYNLRDFVGAVSHYNSALESGYEKSVIITELMNIGKNYRRASYYDEAIQVFKQVYQLDNTQKIALLQIAISYNKLEDYIQSIEFANKYIESKEDFAGYYYLASSYDKSGQKEEAAKAYSKALAQKPKNKNKIVVMKNLLTLYNDMKEYGKVIEYGEQLLNIAKKDKDKKAAAIKIALANKELGNTDKAGFYFMMYAGFLKGDNRMKAYYSAFDLFVLTNPAKAEEIADEALAYESNDWSNFMKGYILYKTKKYGDSKPYLGKISTGFEQYSMVKKALDWMKEQGK